MADIISRPAEDIFKGKQGKSFMECMKVFAGYLEAGGDTIALKDRMEVTLQLCRCYAESSDFSEAEKLLSQCENYITTHGREEEKACIINIKALMAAANANFEEGIALALRSLYLFQQLEFPFFIMNSYVVCGHMCARMNLYNEAIDYLTSAQTIATEMGDRRQAIICTMNLNDVRMMVLPPDDCIKNNKELLVRIQEVYEGLPSYAEAGTYLQLAHLYFGMGDIKMAEAYADRSMAVTRQLSHLPEHHLQYINLYAVKAEIAGAKGDEKEVVEYTKENLQRANQSKNMAAQASALFFLTRFYLSQKNISKAKTYIDEAMAIVADDEQSDLYLQINETYCQYYSAMGDSASELKHFKMIYKYKMKRQQEALSNRVSYMATIHELELHKKELAQQKTELDFKTQELNMTTYHLQQRNQLLTDLKDNIDELKKDKAKNDVVFKTITKRIDQAFVKEEVEKVQFREKFDEAHRGFIARLHQKYPEMSPTECRICALLRSGFNSKEISNLLSTSVRNVENHRVHIRKKMNLSREDNLNLILTQIN